MGDPFGRWSSSPSRSEYDDRTPLQHSNSFVRLTGKSIYNQRKDYGQTLLKLQNDFQYHVEHLLTMPLERELRSAEDCLGRLRDLEEQGRVWGQDVILEVKDQELVLSDVESKEELEAFPLGSVQGCSAGLDNAVLAVSVQERNPPRTSVLLFQCERLGAETLRSSLEKVLRQRKEEQSNHYGHRYGGRDTPPSPPPYAAPERWAEPPEPDPHLPPRRGLFSSDYRAPEPPQMPRSRAPVPAVSEADRDVVSPDRPDPSGWGHRGPHPALTAPPHPQEILNHVLGDLERFMGQLKAALSSASTKKKLKKPALPPKDEYTDFFQKVKYALNLLGRSHRYVTDPAPSELLLPPERVPPPGMCDTGGITPHRPIRRVFGGAAPCPSLQVLDHCPSPGLAAAVQSPLLLPEALDFLEENLGDDDYGVWKSLGTAWNKSRAEYPNGALVPAYTPVFSDGWLPPVMEQERRGGFQDTAPPASVSPAHPRRRSPSLSPAQAPATGWRDHPGQESPLPARGLVRALYDFQARNSQELSVRKGDTLQVLDQQRKWWLVQDERGDRGHVPGNILEPVPELGHSARQDSPPSLHPSSSPAEVTAWLMDKGFSRITVRTLGVLRGHELLQMSPAELRGVCPEEWRRVLFKLSPIRTSLGIGPRD
ncbi:epidermal growth factor receptor kinase substrate 8-like protein 3 [Onychostruthus taczanowskii]|uniref:epidermal growth factor receptor kinase substrate 8-like protein 3 n=1 Tax=Onychostruthus taczanowskii TaxID=356909 RepID=UPI001B80DD92|nr:epidermal growth factor receptor kinase substrate 8-like protein 3 [Onychostruthus taczanowskii]